MQSHTYEICLALGVVIPLISFAILAFFGANPPFGKPKAAYVALGAIGISCLLSIYVLVGWLGLSDEERALLTQNAFRYDWGVLGTIPITVGVKLDSLTVIMYFMVTFVSTCIHAFSVGYMAGHSDEVDGRRKYHRFFAYLSLFCFSMLGLVVSSSLLFLFIFWELVGLCSYLLIGFYFDKKFASDAAIKAFVTNRVGDFGFIVGLALVVLYTKTFDLDQAAAAFATQFRNGSGIFDPAHGIDLFGWQVGGMTLATLMGIGLFCGAMGKSAQFPLHVWLPDAMAGPTPVSALIHAATMVAAGVYLVARVFRLLTPDAQFFIAVIGCITLTITALIAIVQTDIKKVLAYSTLSQLGYMVFGMGVGAWIAALFHLMTHAFFKAMLFLCSGQVIEGCHHEQNIMKMGGLRKKMPWTSRTFLVGVLAIAGAGIPAAGIGLGGYFSKDEILAVAYERAFNMHHEGKAGANETERHGEGHARTNDELRIGNLERGSAPVRLVSHASNPVSALPIVNSQFAASETEGGQAEHAEHAAHGSEEKTIIARTLPNLPKWMFWLPILIAYVTPFYMMRCHWLTFQGKPRDKHVYDHAHEMPWMWVPLVVLAVGTFICSYFIFRPLIAHAGGDATNAPAVVAIDGEAHAWSETPGQAMLTVTHGGGMANPHNALALIVGFAWVIGIGLAWFIYKNGPQLAGRLKETVPGLGFVHRALEQKLYFDHVYNFALVGGIKAAGRLWGWFDNTIIDGIVDLTALFARGLGVFAGRQLDMPVEKRDIGLVDTLANGLGQLVYDTGSELRRPQNGRIRTYVLLTAGAAAIALVCVLYSSEIGSGFNAIVSRVGALASRD